MIVVNVGERNSRYGPGMIFYFFENKKHEFNGMLYIIW